MADFDLTSFMKQLEGKKFPPVDKWNPDFCGDIDMKIAADGTWFYMGTPIGREKMVKLFSSVLRKDEDGKTYLVTPVEKIGIQVEDAHFVATHVETINDGDDQALIFTTNVGDQIVAGPEHQIRVDVDPETGEPRPYINVRARLEALISRNVYYELIEKGAVVEKNGDSWCSIRSRGVDFSLGVWRG